MKLLYTDVRTSLTEVLTHQATKLAVDKHVFYLAPNSLSFEKEREVVSYLPNQSTFSITVTRFKQLARYILPSGYQMKKGLDNIGLGMVFYKCLSELDSEAFNIYGELKQDRQFIQQLINLYHDMISAQMDFTDLEKLDDEAKRKDLVLIFDKVTRYLNHHQLALGSPLTSLIEALESNEVSVDFTQFAFVIDGFTRFSAEEEYIIKLLHRKGSEIVIGCYASEKAFSHPLLEGNLYQASIEFLNGLSREFQTKVEDYTVKHDERDVFEQVSHKIESSYDFSKNQEKSRKIETNQEQLQIWSCLNQKEELELIARDIRQKLNDNSNLRYKHFRILLGDVDSYHLSLKTIFDQYKIPVYFAKPESMSHHSLAQFVESILRLKRYRFRQEDLLNLLKTGLYTDLSQEDIDAFEQYVRYLDINGLAAFEKTFTKSHDGKFDVKHLDDIRKQVLSPLVKLLSTSSLSSEQMLQQWSNFLKEARVPQNLESLSLNLDLNARERQLEVWKAFIQIQYQFATVFETSKTTIEDFLALLHSGISLSRYRTIPATVDTVLVQSYDLISPLTSDYVYALGLTQDNFPKIAQNNGLLSDEERHTLNQVTGENSKLPIVSKENLKKSRYTFVSLLNSARKQLVLSSPSLLKEGKSEPSKYFNELNVLFSPQAKIINSKKISKEDLGSYHSLLSSLVAYHQQADKIEDGEDLTFMKVLARVMSKKLQAQGLENPALPTVPTSRPLSSETLSALYPADKDFYLSTSALTEFYKNEYSYFLVYVLKLQEELRLRPDARNHGMFLHRIFELVMDSDQNPSFDKRLSEAINKAIQEEKFSNLYHEKSETRFTQEVLLDIVHTVAPVLKNNDVVEAIQQEAKFGGNRQPFLQLENGRNIFIRGQIDRIDCLKGINHSESSPIGIVDYKSSDTRFDYRKFYNGLNSQLPTYLSVLQKERTEPLFGAMYLPMMEKIESLPLDLSKLKGLQYQGLFLSKQAQNLGEFYNHNEANQLSSDELQLLLDYNLYLYKKAAERILSGRFLVNPYSDNGKSIAPYVPQHQAITGFEANLHLGQARILEKLVKNETKEKLKQAWLQKIREELDK